ncbi:hypothetical protein NDU88_002408 [Pleurodeles waltl]|uniref:Uncharacterized protein n=1 Tax=Pleurodeles waltl TaxID=8319 RepID=A0AAV7W3Y3_PLEWA|nr:hypothetical protein NDU88_002408 [Pleurodeles waltl]
MQTGQTCQLVANFVEYLQAAKTIMVDAGTEQAESGPRRPVLADWCCGRAGQARRSDRGEAPASQRIRLTGLEAVRRSSVGPYPLQRIARRDLRGGGCPPSHSTTGKMRWGGSLWNPLRQGPRRALKTPVGLPPPIQELMLCGRPDLGDRCGATQTCSRKQISRQWPRS